MLGHKKDKCIEVIRQSTEIHELIVSQVHNPSGMDLSQIVDSLFSNTHFINLLGELLTKRAATAKLEKFFAQQVKDLLRESHLDAKI